jgi:hypothetical protein
MPSKEKPRNHHHFHRCLGELSETIRFEQPDKLADFIRRTMQWLLTSAPIKSRKANKPVTENGLSFGTRHNSILTSEFELAFYQQPEKQDETPIAVVKIRDNYYKGLPDNHPTLVRLDDLPPLVARRLLFAQAFRRGANSEWSKIQHNGNGALALDLQLNGNSKKK